MKLSEQDKSHISELAARVEARTGIQVLAVVTGKSDAYPEIPWKAFSMGAALATLAQAVAVSLRLEWDPIPSLLSWTAVLGAGMVLALAAIFLHPVARLFLGKERAAEETKQYAQSLFLERGLTRTQSRTAVLILASQFEHRSAIVADTGIIDRIPQTELEKIAAAMDASLARGSAPVALAGGLSTLEELLLQRGFAPAPGAGDEIAQEFLETEGPKP
jgi:putative membrane protein